MKHPARDLSGQTIWVTGGAGYLGSAVVRNLDAECAKIICIDLPGKAEAMVTEHGLQHTVPVTLDVNNAGTLPGAIDALVAEHGLPDGVVLMAYASSGGKRLADLPAEEFQHTFDHALTPSFVFCRALAERMAERGHGNFVLYTSMYGMVPPDPRIYHDPMTPNPIDYGASKAALIQLTRYLAVHYGPRGLRFNCVSPGPFPNPAVQEAHPQFTADLSAKVPLGRVGSHEEMVGPTAFLLSESASFVNGHNLVVDGGWTVW
jgi:NAD(P)-dependent dehydrogenase (short-subunit alcohol dehydrogenase family)